MWIGRWWNSREVLEKDSRWRERHLGFILLLLPVQNVLHVGFFGVEAITVTDCCLQEDTDGQRQLVYTEGQKNNVLFCRQSPVKSDHSLWYICVKWIQTMMLQTEEKLPKLNATMIFISLT